MSKYREEFNLSLSLDDSLRVCREAVADIGWRVMEQTATRLTCKEVTPQVTSFTWAAKVEILLSNDRPNETRVVLDSSIFGFGPIQSGHLKGQVGNLRNKIELAASKSNSPADAQPLGSLAFELEQLAQLHTEGKLSDEEFQAAKSKIIGK